MRTLTLKCTRCNEAHSYEIADEDLPEGQGYNFGCLNIKRLPRVTTFRFDAGGNIQTHDDTYASSMITGKYGSQNIQEKIDRWNKINQPRIWFVHDFDAYVEEILDAYVSGYFYSVATACTTLAERLANLFILKMRDLYDQNLLDSENQRYVYSRSQSWQNYKRNMEVLEAWNLLSANQKSQFKKLYKIRKRAVHFQQTFDAHKDAEDAIMALRGLIDSYFSQFDRKDILRVFEIPGEIWVKEAVIEQPFVKAFVLPNCSMCASCGVVNDKKIYHEEEAIVGTFSEDEFIEQRKKFNPTLDKKMLEFAVVFNEEMLPDGRKITYRVI